MSERLYIAYEIEPEIYEPYTLADGQRVRIRHSAECRPPDGNTLAHDPVQDGATGRVSVRLLARAAREITGQGHHYAVKLDDPYLSETGLVIIGGVYTLSELVPLEGEEETSDAQGDADREPRQRS